MACTTTTSMYLNISTQICASGSASRSGNTVTISGTLSVSQSGSWNTNAIYAYIEDQTEWTKVKNAGNVSSGSASFSFSFTTSSSGTRTYTAIFQVFNNAESGGVGGTASVSFSVSYPSGASAPSGGYINDINSYWEAAYGINVATSAAGVTNDGGATLTDLYWCVSQSAYSSSVAKKYQNISNGSPGRINEVSGTTGTYFDLVGNTQYYVSLHAANSAGSYNYTGQTVVTAPEPFTISYVSTTFNTATIYYDTTNDGGYYAKTFEYSLDGGETWNLIEVITGGALVSRTYTITGLKDSTKYSLRTRVRTTAGTTECFPTDFSTAYVTPNFYSSVSSQATHTNKFYAGSNSGAKKIYKMYCSRNGRATPFFVRHIT